MKTTRNAVAVGVVTIAVIVGVYYSIRFVSESTTRSGQYMVWALFPDATGLVEGSRVRIAGIPVGYIESITLQSYVVDGGLDDAGVPRRIKRVGARVDIAVEGDVALYENGKALRTVASMVTGDYQIVFLPGDPGDEKKQNRRLKDGDEIEAVGETGLLGEIDTIAQDIKSVTHNLNQVFGSDEGGRQMGEVLANLRDISKSINKLLEQNSEAFTKTMHNIESITEESRPGLKEIVENMRELTAALKEFVERNDAQASEAVANANATIKDMRQAVQKLDRVLGNVEDVTAGVAEGEGTVGRLLKDDKLIDDVENVVEKAGEFVDDLTALKIIVGLSSEFNFYDNSMKTGLQLRLQPREDKYYLIEAIYDPRGATERKEVVVESTNPDEPAQYREVRTITRDSLLFSLMFARRIHFATFRMGIKESSGGLGLDLHMLRDRVELVTDLYRFGYDVYPRLKTLLAMEFLKHLYIIGGVNDVMNESRDYFIGLMVRFNDEDLKSILAFSPSVPAS